MSEPRIQVIKISGDNVSPEVQQQLEQASKRALTSFQAVIKDTPDDFAEVVVVTSITAAVGELAGRAGKAAVIQLLSRTMAMAMVQIPDDEPDGPCGDPECLVCKARSNNPIH